MVDVNVVLDVLLDREPFVQASGRVWAAVETRKAEGILAAHAVTTIHYLIRKDTRNSPQAKRILKALLAVFGVAAVDQNVIQRAIDLPGDFEDAVTAAAAGLAGCDFIVTRDPKGFRGFPVLAVTAESAAHILHSE